MKKIVLLGASGSIGSQTLDVIRHHQDEFELVGFSLGKRVEKVSLILNEFDVHEVCVGSSEDAKRLSKQYPNVHFMSGDEGLLELVSIPQANWVVNALVGSVGLKPTLCAIEHDKNIALANKESLVVGGKFVKEALKKHHVELTPIDSEHSAIFQCLQGIQRNDLDKLIITASGGSFRDKTRDELKGVSVKEALLHPNWRMGAKITIDSATLMNKGFEVIEAHYLFDVDYDDIEVLLHKESIIHSLIQTKDTALLAQLGTADMRLPIQYALSYPDRFELVHGEKCDLAKIGTLHFDRVDENRFPLLRVAYECGQKEGNACAILNAANEVAVHAFLNEEIEFLDIEKLIFMALENIEYIKDATLEDIFETDQKTRCYVESLVKGGIK
ncbi:MAG: 1-deoxy-D-xylulose-5-phosphate reductoisomerase [Traorella sp.]